MKPVRKKRKKRKKHQNYLMKDQIKDLKSLIKISERSRNYDNIDLVLLNKINPSLKKLDNIIGMENTKQTIFLQLLYYLQKLNVKNSDYLHTLILGPPGCGKCLGYNTPIRMFNSKIKQVQNIVKGDLIMGDDSTPRIVLSITKDTGQLYKVKQSNGMDYIINEYHILTLINPNNEIIDIPIYDYLKLSNKKKYKGFKKNIIYPKKNVEINPYLLGLWLGSTSEDINSIDITDINILYNLYTKLKSSDLNIVPSQNCVYKIKGKPWEDFIKKYGFDKKDKYLPEIYKFNSKIIRLNLLHGLTESVNSLKFKEDIKFIDYSLNIENKLSNITIEKLNVNNYYGFVLDGNKRFMLEDGTITHNTTLAKILGELYSNMNILSGNNIFKKVTRDDFVAGYVGQTAIKTKALLDSCYGGVLFIDEIYSFGSQHKESDSFSKEAIDTLNEYLSAKKDNFCCIIAGYEEEVKNCFFSINKGLERRFQWIHRISDYTPKDLADIFIQMIKDIGWFILIDNNNLITIIDKNNDIFKKSPGNIEILLAKTKLEHSKRIFGLDRRHRYIITKIDIINGIEKMKKNLLNTVKEDNNHYNLYI